MLTHTGSIYFHPVRYNNEAGDFCNWALSTLAVTQGLYQHAWHDSVHHILRRMDEYTRSVAHEVEEDLPLYRMVERWNHLHRRVFLGETAIYNWHVGGGIPAPGQQPLVQEDTEPIDMSRERQRLHDQAALDLMYDPHYVTYNRFLNGLVDRESRYPSEPVGSHYAYLTELLGDPLRHFAGQRTEEILCQELRELMRVTDYVVRFATSVAPMTDRMTEVRRQRCLHVYMGVGTTLLMFAPSFRRVPTWRPSEGPGTAAGRIPRIDLQANHRHQRYLRFLNRRTLFYTPKPHTAAELWTTEVNPRW